MPLRSGHVLRFDRSTAAAATFAIHVGVIAVLMMPTITTPRSVPRALAVFDISAAAAMADTSPPKAPQPEPVTPTLPQPIIVPPPVIPLPSPNETVISMLEQTDVAASGGACDLTDPVQAALQQSEAVAASLPQIPQARRSVANAIMVWNAHWVSLHETLDPAAMAAIRDTVAGTVAAASPECRLQPQSGPRLILLPGVSETTVLAVGSGVWRWQDLLDTARSGSIVPDVPEPTALTTLFAGLDRASIAAR